MGVCKTPQTLQNFGTESWKKTMDLLDDTLAQPNPYSSILRKCGNLKALSDGKHIHDRIVQKGLEKDSFLGNLLLQMYGNCGALADAHTSFEKMLERDQFSWNFIIRAYARYGRGKVALELFTQMQWEDVMPDKFIFASTLCGCATQESLAQGRLMHAQIARYGFDSDVVVGTALVSMYGKCGSLEDVRRMFNSMGERNTISWNSLIAAYVHSGHGKDALQLLKEMQQEGVMPGKITFLNILDACASDGNVFAGKQTHACTVSNEFDTDTVIGTALVNMYGKCGCIEDAYVAFDKIANRDVVSWNAMIAAYAQQGLGEDAFHVFEQMQLIGVRPDNVTYVSILDACASQATLNIGRNMHYRLMSTEFVLDVVLGTALVNMYGKCGSIEDAWRLFDKIPERNVVTWNAMIALFIQNGESHKVLRLFELMHQECVIPDKVTSISYFDACAVQTALAEGKQMHARVVASGFELDVVMGSALISMYGECGNLEDARMVLCEMPEHNSVTFVNLFSVCVDLGAIGEGKRLHTLMMDTGVEMDVVVATALVNMYAKCGMLDSAWKIFHNMHVRNVVTWNSMIAAHAQQGQGQRALELFELMRQDGIIPDEVTFVSVLSACSHSGLSDDGQRHFSSIERCYGITPVLDHYNCLIDILGRAGRLDEAEHLIKNMPLRPTAVTWATLLGACRHQIDVERGERAANHLFLLDPQNPVPYVTLSNIYAATGRDDDAAMVLEMMKKRGLKTQPSCSSIEVNGRVHTFLADGVFHPHNQEIYDELQRWDRQMEEVAWVLDKTEHMLCSHTERLAVAFGLISLPAGTTLLVTKNFRMCPHCHCAIKFVSKFGQRNVIVRDGNRIHHMNDGVCSCADRW